MAHEILQILLVYRLLQGDVTLQEIYLHLVLSNGVTGDVKSQVPQKTTLNLASTLDIGFKCKPSESERTYKTLVEGGKKDS